VKNNDNRPSHITRGDVLDDLGFSRSEASALKVKATLLDAILQEIQDSGYTQNQLIEILDEYQPAVSNLMRGKIAKMSLEKLLRYSDRLNIKTTLKVHTVSSRHRDSRVHSSPRDRSRKRFQTRSGATRTALSGK